MKFIVPFSISLSTVCFFGCSKSPERSPAVQGPLAAIPEASTGPAGTPIPQGREKAKAFASRVQPPELSGFQISPLSLSVQNGRYTQTMIRYVAPTGADTASIQQISAYFESSNWKAEAPSEGSTVAYSHGPFLGDASTLQYHASIHLEDERVYIKYRIGGL